MLSGPLGVGRLNDEDGCCSWFCCRSSGGLAANRSTDCGETWRWLMVTARLEPAGEHVNTLVGVKTAEPVRTLPTAADHHHVRMGAHIEAVDDAELAAADAGSFEETIKMGCVVGFGVLANGATTTATANQNRERTWVPTMMTAGRRWSDEDGLDRHHVRLTTDPRLRDVSNDRCLGEGAFFPWSISE